VDLDGDLAGADFPSDLLVHESASGQRHHLAFARHQRGIARLERKPGIAARAARAVALQRMADGVEQFLFAERLGQEIDGTAFHRAHGHRDVAEAGHEDDRQGHAVAIQLVLQVESAAALQAHVEQQAAAHLGPRCLCELGHAAVAGRIHADRAQQARQAVAHVGVVVDHVDQFTGRVLAAVHGLRSPGGPAVPA
jgi:hypothetical protein